MLTYLKKHWRSWIVFLLCVVFAALIVLFSDAFQQCINNTYSESTDYEPEKGVAQILTTLGWAKACTGQFLKEDGEAITAFFTLILGLFTGALWLSTRALWEVTNETLLHNKRVERAYVKMSHRPPGLDIKANTGLIYIDMGVKNFGSTPADITYVMFKTIVLPHNHPLPEKPDYSGDRVVFPQAFLVSQEEFFIHHPLKIAEGEIIAVLDYSSDLYVIGYVDYIDKFGDRHRGGYARQYAVGRDDRSSYRSDDAFANRSNLIFVTAAGYNYDRARAAGEGNDWKDT
jgi:hypothetical protein